MFKEKYLISKSTGSLDDIVETMRIDKDKREIYSNVLHNNATTSPWNTDKIAKASEISMKISDEIKDHRSKLKKVFWELPKEAGTNLVSMLSRAAFVFPAWLWSKTTQLPGNLAKLISSGVTVVTAETIEMLDAPARLMVKTNNKIQAALGAGGGHGHGMPAPAGHGH